jgi:DNA-binding CsgD family transcriptional regulator
MSQTKKKTDWEIVGEFFLNQHRYLVAKPKLSATEIPWEDALFSINPLLDQDPQFKQVGNMFLDDQKLILLESKDRANSVSPALKALRDQLSERELQIAMLVALGQANKQIAKKLKISEWTVATYLRRIFAKLNIDSRTNLAVRCYPILDQIEATLGKVIC